ncbi:MAG TPA: hypothetical protein VFH66_01325 [Mycobacteriales bacterium]|nr:hypothetical protein [Mycobacteriales bacterium]
MARSARLLPVAAYVLAFVGLVLLVLEVVRTLNGSALGTLGAVLLWVGVGFIVVAIVLLALTMLAAAADGVGAVDDDASLQP